MDFGNRKNLSKRILFSILLLIIIYVAFGVTYLRPSADDYCFGVNASFGVVGGVLRWWNQWCGFVLSMFLGNLFVGIPLVYLPSNFASAIPFWVSSFAMGLTFSILFPKDQRIPFSNSFLILLVIFSWWCFIWMPVKVSRSDEVAYCLSYGLVHWQTLNGMYVLQILIIISTLAVLSWAKVKERQLGQVGLFVVTGFLIGTSGTAVALAFFSGLITLQRNIL